MTGNALVSVKTRGRGLAGAGHATSERGFYPCRPMDSPAAAPQHERHNNKNRDAFMLNHLIPAGILAGALGLALFAQSLTSAQPAQQARLDINPWGQLAGEFDNCNATRPHAGAGSCAPGVAWQVQTQPPLLENGLASR